MTDKVVISQPLSLYKSLRSKLFRNPFNWFIKDGYKFSIFLLVIGILNMSAKHSLVLTNENILIMIKLILLSLIAPMLFYPLAYLEFILNLRVIISKSDIWIKKTKELIRFEKIEKVNIRLIENSSCKYFLIEIVKINGKISMFYVDKDEDISIFKQALKDVPIEIIE